MKSAVIIGASDIGTEAKYIYEQINSGASLYVADGGIDFCLGKDLVPDVYVGDMDSISGDNANITKIFPDMKTYIYPPEKDDTDMSLAVSHAINDGCEDIHIFGGLGGMRISHSIANIQMLETYVARCKNISLYTSTSKLYVISGGNSHRFDDVRKGYVSVFSLSDVSKDVTIEGFKYNYKGTLSSSKPLGVSNEIKCSGATISVLDGMLLIIEEFCA